MPTYCYTCDKCGRSVEDIRPVSQASLQGPDCHGPMRRDYGAEQKQVGMIDGENVGFYGLDEFVERTPEGLSVIRNKQHYIDTLKRRSDRDGNEYEVRS